MTFLRSFEAMAQAAGEKPEAISMFDSMLPIVFLVGIFYFLIIRPQAKKTSQHQKMMSELRPGDEVHTSGGIIGRIKSVSDQFISIEIANQTVIKVLKGHISGLTKSKQEVVKNSKNPKKAKVVT